MSLAVLRSGRYAPEWLVALAARRPGVNTAIFPSALPAIRRLPGRIFAGHGLGAEQIADAGGVILTWPARLEA
jgi:hypothetical protein